MLAASPPGRRLLRAGRSATALAGLVASRIRSASGALGALAVGIALSSAVLTGTYGVLLSAGDAAMRSTAGPAGAELAATITARRLAASPTDRSEDAAAEQSFPRSGLLPGIARVALFAPDRGRALAAVDGGWSSVRLRHGRRARACSSTTCEAVAIGTDSAPLGATLAIHGVRLRIVGAGDVTGRPLGPLPPPSGLYQSDTRFFIVSGVAALAARDELGQVPRTRIWSRRVNAGAVHPWTVDAMIDDLARLRDQARRALQQGEAAAPLAALAGERDRVRAAGAHGLLVAGMAAAVLLALVAFAGAQRRGSVQAETLRLRAAGSGRTTSAAFVVLEVATVSVAASTVGWAAGQAMTLAAAASFDVPGWPIVMHSGLSASGITLAASVTLASTLALSVPLLTGLSATARAVLEAGTLALTAALAWQAAARGGVGPAELARGGGIDPTLAVLPAAALACAAIIAARALPPGLRAAERLARGRSQPVHLASLSLARRPEAASAVVVCIAAAIAASVFATSYWRALDAAESAANDLRVPAAVVARGADAANRQVPETLADRQGSVMRMRADTLGGAGRVELIGAPADFVDGLAASGRAVPVGGASAVVSDDVELAGEPIPTAAEMLDSELRLAGAPLTVAYAFQQANGRFARLNAGTLQPGEHRVRLLLPASLRGARLIAIEATVPLGAGASADFGSLTVLRLATVGADGATRTLTRFDGWEPVGRWSKLETTDGSARLRFRLVGATGYLALRRRQPASAEILPAVATAEVARTAGSDRTLQLTPVGGGPLLVRITQAVDRIPSGGRLAVAVDTRALFAAVNAATPGYAQPVERWIETAAPARTAAWLRRNHGSRIATVRRDAALARTMRSPLVGGMHTALAMLAALGILAAVAATALTLAFWLREQRAELVELEAAGVSPRTVRRHLQIAAAVVAGAGALVGVAAAALSLTTVAGVVQVGIDGRAPIVPPSGSLAWAAAAATVGATGTAIAVLSLVRLRRAFAADRPGRLGA